MWAAAAASAGIDMDTDSGSGAGGGAIEARFKALEDENAKLRREMGGVVSTVKDLVTTVKDIGANMNMGFAQVGICKGCAAYAVEPAGPSSTSLTHPRHGRECCDDRPRSGRPAGNDL